MMRTIVVPLDGTPFGEQAIVPAAAIARRAGAALHLVHVSVPVVVGDSLMQYTMVDVETPQQARDYLADVLLRLGSPEFNPPPVAQVLAGPVTDVVQEYVRAHDADLVVMTTHATGPLTRLWMGSVADELIRAIPAPVLLVRAVEGALPAPPVAEFRHVLVAADGSPHSEDVLGPAAEIARLFGAVVTLLRVVPPEPTEPVKSTLQPPVVQEIHLGHEPGATPEQYLDRLAERLRGLGLTAEARLVTHDHPETAIVEVAKETGCDLIALETHGRSGFSRLFHGSITDRVARHAECPVLIHRTGHDRHPGESS